MLIGIYEIVLSLYVVNENEGSPSDDSYVSCLGVIGQSDIENDGEQYCIQGDMFTFGNFRFN